MKRLLLPLLAAIALPTAVEANWRRYASENDALNECVNWAKKRNKYYVTKHYQILGDSFSKLTAEQKYKYPIKEYIGGTCAKPKEGTQEIRGWGFTGLDPEKVHYEDDFWNAFKDIKGFKY